MSSEPFGVRSARRGGSLKRRVRSETSLNLRCAARAAATSHGIFRRRRTSPRAPLIGITCRKNTIRNQRKTRRPNARTSHASGMSHLARLR